MTGRPALGAVGLLFRMGVAMAVFVFGGYGLDRALGTGPWLLLAGALLGVAASLADLAATSRRYARKKNGG